MDNISRSAFFYKAPGNKPTPIAAFRPFFIDEPGDDFKAEVKELIPMLKDTYGEAFIKKTTQELKKEGTPNPKKEARTRAIEGRFYGISDLFEDTFGGVPDRNSLKMWLVKNFPKFKVPGKKD